jgi:hypothetical protein
MTTWKTDYWNRLTSDSRDLDPAFARHLREIARPIQIAFTKLMRASNGDPVGFEVKSNTRQAWKVILPEPLPAGATPLWRVLAFDADGFSGHSVHKTVQSAAEDMLQSGFAELDVGALSRCATSEQWSRGLRLQDLRDRVSRGEITVKDMYLEANAL